MFEHNCVWLPVSSSSACGAGYVIVLCLSLSVDDNSFLRQIMNLNFSYILTSSQEKKKSPVNAEV